MIPVIAVSNAPLADSVAGLVAAVFDWELMLGLVAAAAVIVGYVWALVALVVLGWRSQQRVRSQPASRSASSAYKRGGPSRPMS